MIHKNVLFGYDFDDETKTLIAKDWIRNYGFFSTFTLMLTSIMQVYKKFGVLVEHIDSKEALHLLKKEVPLDFDIYNYLFKIDNNYIFPDLPQDFPLAFGPDDHHTLYSDENIKYYEPFFKRYFSLSDNLNERYNFLKNKYNINSDKTISIIYRDSDKWTDFGGFNYISAGAYMRLARELKELNPDYQILIQTENEGVKNHFSQGLGALSIEETKTAQTNYSAPLIHFKENILEWAADYVCSLYLHAQSKYLVTYTGNSSFFLYLKRGTTKNLYQEITFKKDYKEFFINNYQYTEKKMETIEEKTQQENLTPEPKVIISLSTVPDRLELNDVMGAPAMVRSLCNQNYNNYEVHFNIPYIHKAKNKEYIIPEWLQNMEKKYSHLKICRTEDLGPATKIIPTIERVEDPETILIVLDDDFIYNKDMIKEHVKHQKEYERAAIGYDGLNIVVPKYKDGRDRFVCLVNEPTEVYMLQHYRTVSYKRKYFEQDFFDLFVGKTMSDDALVSLYMRYKEIPSIVVPILGHKPINSLQEHDNLITTYHFPIDQPAASLPDTGANDPALLKMHLGAKFYSPPELEELVKYKQSNFKTNDLYKLGIKYMTDKANPHSYASYYDKHFSDKRDKVNSLLEIGVYEGGSLRMWRDYFDKAKIYGLDINPSNYNEDRIQTYVVNQSKRNELDLFVDMVNIDYFDVIVDDGSHIMKDQQISLGCLFKHLKSGGTYILEDLHTSMDMHGDRFGLHSSKISTYNMLVKFIETGEIESEWMTEDEILYLKDNIQFIEIIVPEDRTIYDSCTSLIIKK